MIKYRNGRLGKWQTIETGIGKLYKLGIGEMGNYGDWKSIETGHCQTIEIGIGKMLNYTNWELGKWETMELGKLQKLGKL